MDFKLADIGWQSSAEVRDVWAHANLPKVTTELTADVPQHGVALYVLTK
jgi:hypothetical protein